VERVFVTFSIRVARSEISSCSADLSDLPIADILKILRFSGCFHRERRLLPYGRRRRTSDAAFCLFQANWLDIISKYFYLRNPTCGGMGNGERGMGNGEWGTGVDNNSALLHFRYSTIPQSHYAAPRKIFGFHAATLRQKMV